MLEWCLPYIAIGLLALLADALWKLLMSQSSDARCPLPLPPGEAGLPIVGETLQLTLKGFDFFREKRAKYGRIYKTHIFGRPTIRVFGSDNIRKILKSEELLVTLHSPKSTKLILGEGGLAHSSRRMHSRRRTHLFKAFTNEAIAGYVTSVQTVVRRHLNRWSEATTIIGHQRSRHLAIDVTALALFGMTLNEEETTEWCDAMTLMETGLFALPYSLPGCRFSKALQARKRLLRSFEQKLKSTDTVNSSNALYNMLTVLQNSYDDIQSTKEEVEDECVSAVFSSFQGLSSAICTLLMELSLNPHCVDNARRDLQRHGMLEGAAEGDLSSEKLRDLSYVENIVKEVLRLVPPVGGGYRKVLQTFTLEGYQIPKGWTLLYSIRDQHEAGDTGIHDPSAFDPDRWSDDSQLKEMNEYSYMPFGGVGLRSCVGKRFIMAALSVITAELVRNFKWTLVNANTEMKYFPVPYPADRLPINFSSISSTPPITEMALPQK